MVENMKRSKIISASKLVTITALAFSMQLAFSETAKSVEAKAEHKYESAETTIDPSTTKDTINPDAPKITKTEFDFNLYDQSRDLANVGADLPVEPLRMNTKFSKEFVGVRKTVTRTYYVPPH